MLKLKSLKAKERKLRKLRKKANKLLSEIPAGSVRTNEAAMAITSAIKALNNSERISQKGKELLHRLKRK